MMNKAIDKILNKYYFDKFKKEVNEFFIMYFLDYKVKKDNNYVLIEVKHTIYKDTEYVEILNFEYERCLYFIANFDKVRKELKEGLRIYFENNK